MQRSRHRPQKCDDSIQEPLLAPSVSSVNTPRSAPATPEPKYHTHEKSRKTHKHNRFKTLFFIPSIRDSGVTLSTAIDDPRCHKPDTAALVPSPSVSDHDDRFPQNELDFLVTELASQFQDSGSHLDYAASDRADSPTLGSDFGASLPEPRCPKTPPSWTRTRSSVSSGRKPPLPGASHSNSPLRETVTHTPGRKPRPRSLVFPPPKLVLPPLFHSLALTDANVSGQPIRYLSPDYHAGSNTLRIGTCTFLNLAYGASVECGLRVEATATGQKVILQIVQRVVDVVGTGRAAWLLCSETDVSPAFTPAVRSELASRVNDDGKGETLQPRVYRPDATEHGADVWIALAHTISEPVTPMTTRMPVLPVSPPPLSPGLADLLALLTEVRCMHRHFFVVKEKGRGVCWMSSSLRESLAERSMLDAFVWAAATQSPRWLAAATTSSGLQGDTSTARTFRGKMRLPRVSGCADREEEMGVVGVWMSEDAGGRVDASREGCWVFFVVSKGAEEVI